MGRQEIKLSPGDITISPANVDISFDMPEPGMHYCVHFNLPEGDGNMLSLPCYIPYNDRNHSAGTYFNDMIELQRLETKLGHTAANETLRLILLQLALRVGLNHDSNTKLNRKLDTVRQIIEEALDYDISTSDLAPNVNLSPNYLAKAFREKFGTTIKGYQLQKRIERAEFLLKYSYLSIKETGAMVGMPDPQYFNKRFRAVKGMSPTDFRNRAR